MKIFQTYRNPFFFPTMLSPTTSAPSSAIPPSGSSGPIRNMRGKARASGPLSSKQPSQQNQKKIRKGHYPFNRSRSSPFLLESLQSARDKFADLSGTYAPLPIPAWVTANASIDQNSECSQQHEEQVRCLQSEPNMKNNQDYNKGYAFPDPGLLVFTSATRQSSYFHHISGSIAETVLIYHISSSASNATPIRPQVWRELLSMPFKKESTTMTKDHNVVVEMMGTALQAAGAKTTLRVPQASLDQPFNVERGRYLVWELCELNFQLELLALDAYLTRSAQSSTQDEADFQLQHQNTILKLFPEESIVPSSVSEPSGCHLASSVWQDRCGALKSFKDVMQQWVVPLPQKAIGFLGSLEDEASLTVEKSLAAHYAQTFFDCNGRPPVLPCIRPSHQ